MWPEVLPSRQRFTSAAWAESVKTRSYLLSDLLNKDEESLWNFLNDLVSEIVTL